MTIDNRTLLLIRYIVQAVAFLTLVGGLVWGFIVRLIGGEAYLGFVVAILTFMRDRPVFMFEEPPRIVGARAKPLPRPDVENGRAPS